MNVKELLVGRYQVMLQSVPQGVSLLREVERDMEDYAAGGARRERAVRWAEEAGGNDGREDLHD